MNCDIAVIGASSTGLYVASELARAGKKVLVFDQRTSLQSMRRTLIVTPAFSALVPDLLPSIVMHRIHTMRLTTRKTSLDIPLYEPDLIIERSRLIELLAERAQSNGAEILFGYHFQTMEALPEGARLYFKNGGSKTVSIDSRAVIGADGIRSEVAAASGLKSSETVPLLQAEIELPDGWDPTLTQVWFDTNETRYFFWLVPESGTHGVVGLIGDARKRVNEVLQNFMAHHGFKPLGYQAGTVAMHHPRLRAETRMGTTPILLVGDAAGHVKVTTVGGTVSGFLGGAAAVRAILQNTNYHKELRQVQRELNLHWYMRAVLDRLDNSTYDGLAGAVTPEVRQFLSRHNRDEMAPSFWQLLLFQPRLLTHLAASLMRLPVRAGEISGSLPSVE